MSLNEELVRAAAAPRLLVATDFDGVLAPIAPRPELAVADPGALRALRQLGLSAGTVAAVISGRGLVDLRGRLGPMPGVRLVGSHGAESDDSLLPLTPEQAALRERIIAQLKAIAVGVPGLLVEPKPAGGAFHYRLAPPAAAEEALAQALAGPAAWPGVHLRQGKAILDLAVTGQNKGEALRRLVAEHRADLTVFLGDDLTDEDAFAVLGPRDLSIMVGQGATRARLRVSGPPKAWGVLGTLANLRANAGGA